MRFLDPMPDFSDRDHITYLSLGAGVQSTAMLGMSCLELDGCPRADVAIFADTGDEPLAIYDHLAEITEWAKGHGMPVVRVTEGRLSDDVIGPKGQRTRFVPIPAFTMGDGRATPLRRQCTREYKIAPIETAVRRMMGVAKGARIGSRTADCLIGISTDEIQRMKDSRSSWVTNVFPLVEADISRTRCVPMCSEIGLPEPQRSACFHCPYHDDGEWHEMKTNHPEEFDKAVDFDHAIRGMSKNGEPVFLHRSLKPLDEVDFTGGQTTLMDWGMMEECDGMCGV